MPSRVQRVPGVPERWYRGKTIAVMTNQHFRHLHARHTTNLRLAGILHRVNSLEKRQMVAGSRTHARLREFTLARIREKPSTLIASRNTKWSKR